MFLGDWILHVTFTSFLVENQNFLIRSIILFEPAVVFFFNTEFKYLNIWQKSMMNNYIKCIHCQKYYECSEELSRWLTRGANLVFFTYFK